MKKFERSLLGDELKAQADIAEKWYQVPDKIFNSDKDDEDNNYNNDSNRDEE